MRVIQGAGDHIESRTRVDHLPDSPHRSILINCHTNRKRSEAKRFVVSGITDFIQHHFRVDLVHLDAYSWGPWIMRSHIWIGRIKRVVRIIGVRWIVGIVRTCWICGVNIFAIVYIVLYISQTDSENLTFECTMIIRRLNKNFKS